MRLGFRQILLNLREAFPGLLEVLGFLGEGITTHGVHGVQRPALDVVGHGNLGHVFSLDLHGGAFYAGHAHDGHAAQGQGDEQDAPESQSQFGC